MTHPPSSLRSRPAPSAHERGFTLLEMLITVAVLAIVSAALMFVLNLMSHSKQSTTNMVEATQAAQAAMDMMASELRSAGYGADNDFPGDPQPAIAYIDSTEVILAANFAPYPDTGAVHPAPQAYDPAGAPNPYPLVGTQWEPNQKYRTGAELTRYTLDANNDGVVDANDQAAALGSDAQRTRNPDDYVLLRQVYGDSTNNTPHDNGGQAQAVALVRKPGGGVPPLFTVYMRGSATPWNWNNGPVPADQLNDIQRISLQVTSASPQPDARGRYATTTLRTEVNSTRNLPTFLTSTYAIEGYVYNDLNQNRTRDGGEPGIPGATVRVGNSYSTQTGTNGYYLVRVPAGSYTIRHASAPGFGNFTNPDSFVVSVGPGVTRSFADTAAAGGTVTVNVFDDLDGNGVQDVGEGPVKFIKVTGSPGGATDLTDLNGQATLFVPVGFYSILVTVPDTMSCTTTNPATGTMTNGGTATETFGLHHSPNGTVKGRVFNDINRNGVQDPGEAGAPNVWVAVTGTYGVTNAGFGFTNANGDYSINAVANNPPGTTPYYVYFVPPSGFFPTTSSARGPLYLSVGQTISNQNFGIGAFQVISLSASRVLSLASADLMENDWGASLANARKDQDIILGADAGGTDNISVWFNQYNANPIFNPSPLTPAGSGYTRNAPQSVLSIAVDTLDSNPPRSRPDLVTGTKLAGTGNLFVWLNQNSSGNEGYVPATFSAGQNYTTLDAGDVSAVLTLDCSGTAMPDIIAGTRSPTAGNGTIEIWENNGAATPVFTRQEVYPTSGGVPGGRMGEVAGLALADLDGDGSKDLVAVTRTGNYSGELLVFRNVGRVNGARFVCDYVRNISNDAPTCVTIADVDGDGRKDIVVGTQDGVTSGRMLLFTNNSDPFHIKFDLTDQVDAPGIVMSLVSADFGGSGRNDIAMGWRQDAVNYTGGVLIYYTDTGSIPIYGTDPSNGGITYMAPALNANNFNYGVQPAAASPPYLTDLAAGIKITATAGALVVFIR